MKRLLSFLPAVAVGLLAGWLVSKFIVSRADASAAAPSTPSGSLTTSPPPVPGREAWAKMLEERGLSPLPPDAVGSSLISKYGSGALSRMSPARRDFELELSRSALSDAGINDTVLCFPFRNGDAGFAEACARLAKTNPGRALAQVERLSGSTDRLSPDTLDRARRLIYAEWLRSDPQAALAAVTKVKSGTMRGQRLEMLLDEWAKLDPAAAAAALPGLPQNGPQFEKKQLAETVLSNWYEKDPAAARNWAAATTDPEQRKALLAAADELAATTPAAKTAVLLANPQPDHFTLANTFGEWLSAEPAAAMQKLSSIPAKDKFWQNHAADVAEWWALNSRDEKTPEQFLDTIKTVPAGPQREVLLRGLADYGASNDIPFAQRMISEMTEGRDRDQAVSGLTELWMRKDPVKTSEWLTSLPASSDSRNSGVARFAEGLAPDDPERAAQWAATIPDSYWQKPGVMKTVLEKWRAKDPAAAEAWVRNSKP